MRIHTRDLRIFERSYYKETWESQANALGNVLSEMACEVIEQVFMVLLQENQHHSQTGESEKGDSANSGSHSQIYAVVSFIFWQ